MNVKTSASLLREFCAQQKVAPPHFDTVKDATGVFITLGKAFNLSAQGCGRTKKDSMHAASQQLIDQLARMDEYKTKLKIDTTSPALPPPPPPANDNFFGSILTLCMQHNLKSPTIDEISVTGAGSHKPEFTYRIKIGGFETQGVGPTKKEAKRKASEEMLIFLEALFQKEDTASCDSNSTISSSDVVPNVLPLMELPTVEEVLAEYRRLRKPYIQPAVDGLRYRKNFFINLPAANRRKAQEILTINYMGQLSTKEIVVEALRVLGLKYQITSMDKPANYKRFYLVDSEFDCVIIERGDILFVKIMDYLKTMLNLQDPTESTAPETNNNLQF